MVDAWSNILKIAIQKKGGSYVQYAAYMEDVTIDEGKRGGHGEPGLDGSRAWIDEPQTDGTVTVVMRPVDTDPTASSGGMFQQNRGGTWDTSDPFQLPTGLSTLQRDEFRVVVLWTTDAANTEANGSVAAGEAGLRFYADSCRVVDHNVSFANKKLIVNVTFKFPPRNISNSWNYDWQSTKTGGTGLSALGDYS